MNSKTPKRSPRVRLGLSVIPSNSLPLEGRVCDAELLTWVISTRKIWEVRLLPLGRAEGAICRPKVGCRLLPLSESEMVVLAPKPVDNTYRV